MKKYSLYNNEILSSKSLVISTSDRMFKLGDGTFQTIKIKNGIAFDIESYISRLLKSAKIINLKFNFDKDSLLVNIKKLIQLNGIKDGTLRVNLSRGSYSRGYLPSDNCKSIIIATCHDFDVARYESPVNISVSNSRAWPIPLEYCQVKNMKSQSYIQAKIEAHEDSLYDNVILTGSGNVSETSSSNIFWIKDSAIYTPSQNNFIYPGHIRSEVIDLFDITEIEESSVQDLVNSDEIFLTNSNILLKSVDNFIYKGSSYRKSHETSSRIAIGIEDIVSNYCQIRDV